MQYLKTYRTFHTITHIIFLAIENANCFSFKSISTILFLFYFCQSIRHAFQNAFNDKYYVYLNVNLARKLRSYPVYTFTMQAAIFPRKSISLEKDDYIDGYTSTRAG